MELFTDASGSLGYGIFYMGHWLADRWPPELRDRSIQWHELYPIALACLLWGHQWSGKKLLFHCNNQAIVDIWASGTSRDPLIMHLVRSIFFSAATNNYTVLVTHIVGTNNSIADSLSRLQISRFRRLAQTADFEPTPVSRVSSNPLEHRLAFLQSQAIADSTRRSYQAGIRRYSTFCASMNWPSFPATETTLRFFAAYLADQVSFKTIKLYLCSH